MEIPFRRSSGGAGRRLGKLHMFSLGAIAAAVSAVAIITVSTAASAQDVSRVRATGGEIQGVVADGVVAFKGIPVAAPPVGDLRWRPPHPVQPWTGVRPAAEFGPDCMQGTFGPPPAAAPGAPAPRRPSEDCLYLNVWRPVNPTATRLPVMVWIYGGGFTGGGSSAPNSDGTSFAKQGVVLVNFNYRLGRFGFFGHPALSSERSDELKGNYGYMDQINALQWVKDNIAAFGGDPNNVTLFGFSAGAVSVHSLLASPLAQPLFHKVIVQSGNSRDGIITPRPMRGDNVDKNYPASAETIGMNFARLMQIEGTGANAMARLRALSADQVLRGSLDPPLPTAAAVQGPGGPPTGGPPRRGPPTVGDLTITAGNVGIVDGRLIPETAENAYRNGRVPRKPVIFGSNSGDFAGNRVAANTKEELWARFGRWADQARAAYDPDGTADFARLLADVEDDYGQAEGARFAADAFARVGVPTYLYRWSYVPEARRTPTTRGAGHGSEIPYVFGTLTPRPDAPVTPDDEAVSRMMQGYWANFAKTGNPNGPGLPNWPRRAAGTDRIFDIRGPNDAVDVLDPRKARLDVTKLATEAGIRSDY